MPRILYLTPLAPLPVTDGGRQRTNLLYHALSRIGEVSTAIINRTNHPIDSDLKHRLVIDYGLRSVISYIKPGHHMPWRCMGRFSEQCVHAFRGWQVEYVSDKRISNNIRKTLADYDLVVSRYLWTAAVAGVIGGPCPVIIDVDDRESERVRSAMLGRADYIRWPIIRRWWWQRRISQLAAAENRLFSKCNYLWFTKQHDLHGIDALENWSILPNIPFGEVANPCVRPLGTATPTILFVGSLAFSPNRNGVQRFLDRSWPLIRKSFPNVRFRIVGGSAPDSWRDIPGVECFGFVECLDDVYNQASFSVVPLWEGAGTKIKVLESLQRYRTVVASRYALRGYESHLQDDDSLLVGDDDMEIADSCIRLLSDRELAASLAERGREIVRMNYAQVPFNQEVEAAIGKVLNFRAAINSVSKH